MQTLDDLKAANAAEEAALKQPPVKQDSEPLKPDAKPEDDLKDDKPDGDQSDEPDEGAEDWKAEESKEDDADDGKEVPLETLISVRTKLKGRLKDKDSELAKLKEELEALKQSVKAPVQQQVAQPANTVALNIPDPLDFDTTKDYQAAMDKYIADKVERSLSLVSQTSTAKQRQDAEVQARENAVKSHYERAAKLLKDHGISAELYQNADLNVRQAIESVVPDGGDMITEELIKRMGEGSEKVMYFLGRNEEARNKLVTMLMTDKTGLSASMYLGRLVAEKAGAKSTGSDTRAPAPANRAKGSSKSVASAQDLKRKYDKAHERGDMQAVFDAKTAAKAAGIDTKSW